METDLQLEKIIELVTREVMNELGRKGVVPGTGATAALDSTTSVRLDMSKYKTPLVTENAVNRLHERTITVIVPAGAVITPRARGLLREKNITVVVE